MPTPFFSSYFSSLLVSLWCLVCFAVGVKGLHRLTPQVILLHSSSASSALTQQPALRTVLQSDKVSVLDTAPAKVYNATVATASGAERSLERSQREFAKINRLLDKQIEEQDIKVSSSKLQLEQAMACVTDAASKLQDLGVKAQEAREQLQKVEKSATGMTTTAVHNHSSSVSLGVTNKNASAAASSFVQIEAVTNAKGTHKRRKASVELSLSSSSSSSSSSLARSQMLRGLRDLQREAESEELMLRRDARASVEGPVSYLVPAAHQHNIYPNPMDSSSTSIAENPNFGAGARLASVRAFLASAAADAVARNPVLSPISPPLLAPGRSNSGGHDGHIPGEAAGVAGGGTDGGVIGGLTPGSGTATATSPNMVDPSAAVKAVFSKAVSRLRNWLDTVAGVMSAATTRRDECTVRVHELTALLQAQRNFLELLKKRKSYEEKLYLAQQVDERSLAEFARQEQPVLLQDLLQFNTKWNKVHESNPDLQLPPVGLPEWDDYSSTVGVLNGERNNEGLVAAAAFAGPSAGQFAIVSTKDGDFRRIRSMAEPKVESTTEQPTSTPPLNITTSVEVTDWTTTIENATTTSVVETTLEDSTTEELTTTAVVTAFVANGTTTVVSPTPPPKVSTTTSRALGVTTRGPGTARNPQEYDDVNAKDIDEKEKDEQLIPPSGGLSKIVQAWADINQTAANDNGYSSFDITNTLFSGTGH